MKRIVYTGGTFDTLHAGHIKFLSYCRKIAGNDGLVVVALNKDEFIKRFKGKKPIFNYKTREKMLFFNCDDRYSNIYFEKLITKAEKENLDLVFCNEGGKWKINTSPNEMGKNK